MNQILVIGNKNGKKNNSTVDIKKIILVFSVAIIIFGAILLVEGVVGLSKNKNNEENSGIIIAQQTSTPEPIEPDIEDNEEPSIELISIGEKIRIVARDETEIDYVEYGWNDDEKQITNRTNDKNKIEVIIELQSGKNTLKIRAVDKAGNEKTRETDFEKKYKPKLELWRTPEGDGIIIIASCDDGINRIDFTQNGTSYRLPVQESNYTTEQFERLGAIVERSESGIITKVTYTYKGLLEGENRFSIYAYSTKGEVEGIDGNCTYTPPEE